MENTTPQKSFVLPAVIAAVIIIVVVIVAAVRSKDLEAPTVTGSPETSPVATSTPVASVSAKPVATPTKTSAPKPTATVTASVRPATSTRDIEVVTPNGGEQVKKGSHYMITWNTSPAFRANYPQVSITLVASGENHPVTPAIQIITANTGSYDWFVPTGSMSANIKDNVGAYRMTALEGMPLLKVFIQGYPAKTGEMIVPSDFSTNFFAIIN